MGTEARTEQTTRGVHTSPPVRWLGRFGGASYGIAHLVVAWLAVWIAFGLRATGTDRRGVVAVLAVLPLGAVLLWVLTAGLITFGAWQLLYSLTTAGERIASVGRALVALVIASFAVTLVGGRDGPRGVTARLLELRGGHVVLMVIAVGVIAAGVVAADRGLARRFLRDLDPAPGLVVVSGMVGHLAKAVAYWVIGVLLGLAAVRLDPRRSGGLDAALRRLAAQPYGIVLLMIIAFGFVAFGLYCFADARYRRF
jgi:hypothetical protein